MESSRPARVLVVAHKTAATPPLIEAVRERAARGLARFTLLVPATRAGLDHVATDEDEGDRDAQAVLALALPHLREAAGGEVEGKVGDSTPLDAIQDAVNLDGYDEIIISTLPAHVSRWLHLDLPHKLNGLGLPITTVQARE